jgi:hypothetical protein
VRSTQGNGHLREVWCPSVLRSRQRYEGQLSGYFRSVVSKLSEDSVHRLEKGAVLRILDSKHPQDQAAIRGAPALVDSLTPSASAVTKALMTFSDDSCGAIVVWRWCAEVRPCDGSNYHLRCTDSSGSHPRSGISAWRARFLF